MLDIVHDTTYLLRKAYKKTTTSKGKEQKTIINWSRTEAEEVVVGRVEFKVKNK